VHEKAVKKITGTIIGSLKRCKVVDNWPQYESFTAHVDSLAKEVLKHKSEWLSATDVYSIYYDLVYEAINEKSNTEKKFSGLLVDLLYEDGLQQLTNKLINFYVSVPRNYSIYLPLPRVSKNIGHSIQLSETWELACFKNADEVPGGYSRGLMQFSNKLELDKVYLKFNAKGYCNRSLENKA
jgi:IS1 family transposase